MAVRFYNADSKLVLKDKRRLGMFIREIFIRYGKEIDEIGFIFCSDEYLLEINRTSLQHDYYTDIITFDLSERPGVVIGEIYISIERVKDNAMQLDIPFLNELHRVIFHGCLHLCGLKDKKEADIQQMRSAEDACLESYFN